MTNSPSLNAQISALKAGAPGDWEHDTDQALALLAEVTATGRQWDIFMTWQDEQLQYEITNCWMIDEEGAVLLTAGWTGRETLIDVKAPTLAAAGCMAWLMFQSSKAL